MEQQIKLIWDFRGEASKKIAEHHAIHLQEYVTIEKINDAIINIEQISNMHCIAYLVVNESLVNVLREKLKPHRGQKYVNQ